MYILRLLIIAIVLWFAMRAVKHFLTAREARKSRIRNAGNMVCCVICGVYLPESDAIALGDEKFKCAVHD